MKRKEASAMASKKAKAYPKRLREPVSVGLVIQTVFAVLITAIMVCFGCCPRR